MFYLFKSTLCLTLLCLLFRLFFRTDTLFRTNRLLLLGGTLCCVLLPLWEFSIAEGHLWQQPVSVVRSVLTMEVAPHVAVAEAEVSFTKDVFDGIGQTDQMASGNEAYFVFPSFVSLWRPALSTLYLTGAFVVFLLYLFSFVRMFRLIHRSPQRRYGKYRLVLCPERIPSFSWGNCIVLSQEDYENCADEVLLHEQMHLRHRHTWDLLWMEMLSVLHWFNPAVWLLMRDLRELHEFEADNGVLKYGIDATQYQLLLVKRTVGTRLYSMANGFNHSRLKNRINMMLKKRTNGWARLKLLLFVPVTAGTLMAFAQPEVKKTVEQLVKPESVTTVAGRQDSAHYDEWELLEQYFQRKTEESYPGKTADSWNEKSVWNLFINCRDQMMLGKEALMSDVELLRVRWAEALRKSYLESVRKNDRSGLPKLCITYDRGASMLMVRSCLRVIKEAYKQVHDEIRTQLGDTATADLDHLLPIALYWKTPRSYYEPTKYRTPMDVPVPIEVTFIRSDGSPLSEKLKNATLEELKQTLMRHKAEIQSKGLSVSLKVDDSARMAIVNDVKEVIREACSE